MEPGTEDPRGEKRKKDERCSFIVPAICIYLSSEEAVYEYCYYILLEKFKKNRSVANNTKESKDHYLKQIPKRNEQTVQLKTCSPNHAVRTVVPHTAYRIPVRSGNTAKTRPVSYPVLHTPLPLLEKK